MKGIKKISMILALVLAVSGVLSACGTKNEEASGKPYEIVWYNLGDNTKDKDLVNSKISEYTTEKIGATVKMIHFAPADFSEKMKMLLASGEVFDLCYAQNFAVNAESEAYLEIDELLTTNGQGILDVIPENVWSAVTYNGKIYGVPTLKDWATQYVLGCGTALTEKYNIDLSNVKSLADMEPIMEVIKQNEPTIYPTDIRGNDYVKRLLPFEYINDSVLGAFELDGDYTKVINWIETDTAKEFFDMMHRWYKKGYLRPDADTATTSNDIVFYMNTMETLPHYEAAYNASRAEDKKRTFVNIGGPITTTSYAQASVQAISRTSKNPEKTMDFLNMLYTDEKLMNLYVYGIEGQHYTLENGTTVKFPEGVKSDTEKDYQGYPYTQGNRFLLKIPANSPETIWDDYKKFNEEAFTSPALGFVFDISALTAEIAAMNNVYKEYMPALTTGVSDPTEALPKAIEKFKAAGSDKVFAALQAQYDEWRAQK